MNSNEGNVDGDQSTFQTIRRKCFCGVRIGLLFSLILYLAMIVVGIMGKNNCPVNQYIPLFLIVTGVIGLISKLTTAVRDKLEDHFRVKYLESALYTIEFIFLILGSYWVFKNFQPSYDPHSGPLYCKKSVYLFAFIYLAIVYAILIATIAGYLCFVFTMCFLANRSDDGERDVEAQRNINVENRT